LRSGLRSNELKDNAVDSYRVEKYTSTGK